MLISFVSGCYSPGASSGMAPKSCEIPWGITVFASAGVAVTCFVVAARLARRAADGLTIVHAERRQGFELVRQQALLRASSLDSFRDRKRSFTTPRRRSLSSTAALTHFLNSSVSWSELTCKAPSVAAASAPATPDTMLQLARCSLC